MSQNKAQEAFVTVIADSATSTTFLNANSGRLGATVHNDSTVALYLKLGRSLDVEASSSVTVQYDANAATTGVALYVIPDQLGNSNFSLGHLEFVSPTNANGSARLKVSTNAFVPVLDNDNATTRGFTISANAAQGGLEALMPGTLPCLIPIYDGTNFATLTTKYLYIANPSSITAGGALLYFDEDATNDYEKIMGNIADTADETVLAYNFTETATTSIYSVKLGAGDYFELPYEYTGTVTGIWASDASGSARITELL